MAKRSKTVNTMRDKPDRNTVNLNGIPQPIKAREAMRKVRQGK